jgi:hypothetical protein
MANAEGISSFQFRISARRIKNHIKIGFSISFFTHFALVDEGNCARRSEKKLIYEKTRKTRCLSF